MPKALACSCRAPAACLEALTDSLRHLKAQLAILQVQLNFALAEVSAELGSGAAAAEMVLADELPSSGVDHSDGVPAARFDATVPESSAIELDAICLGEGGSERTRSLIDKIGPAINAALEPQVDTAPPYQVADTADALPPTDNTLLPQEPHRPNSVAPMGAVPFGSPFPWNVVALGASTNCPRTSLRTPVKSLVMGLSWYRALQVGA